MEEQRDLSISWKIKNIYTSDVLNQGSARLNLEVFTCNVVLGEKSIYNHVSLFSNGKSNEKRTTLSIVYQNKDPLSQEWKVQPHPQTGLINHHNLHLIWFSWLCFSQFTTASKHSLSIETTAYLREDSIMSSAYWQYPTLKCWTISFTGLI